MIRVAVSGAAGRMGATVCAAVEGAEDMQLVGRADPALGVSVADCLAQGKPEVLVEFSVPAAALANVATAIAAGVHAVVGTTGFDLAQLPTGERANVFVAPNFAIGAVLMMQFAVQAAPHMQAAEVIELHHATKLDRPSGTAARTAALIHEAAPDRPLPPIHSVRLPGLVAHQEVIFGALGQVLTIRHDAYDRTSFMPGVLLAIRSVSHRVGLTVGLGPLLGF